MIRFATNSDQNEVECLWEACFPDEGGFNRYYFDNLYQPSCTLLLIEDNQLCAMLQMLPYTLADGEKATYIYGACTAPYKRKHGYMAKLLHEAVLIDKQRGHIASILIPQEDWLFGFYQKFGYQNTFYTSERLFTFNANENTHLGTIRKCNEAEIPYMDTLYKAVTAKHNPILRSYENWRQQIALFHSLGAGVYGFWDTTNTLSAYAFIWSGEIPWVQELIVKENTIGQAFLNMLCNRLHCKTLKITEPGTQFTLGMAKFYDSRIVSQGYMNLMFN